MTMVEVEKKREKEREKEREREREREREESTRRDVGEFLLDIVVPFCTLETS